MNYLFLSVLLTLLLRWSVSLTVTCYCHMAALASNSRLFLTVKSFQLLVGSKALGAFIQGKNITIVYNITTFYSFLPVYKTVYVIMQQCPCSATFLPIIQTLWLLLVLIIPSYWTQFCPGPFQFLRGIWERGKHCSESKLKSLRQESSIYGLLIILCKQTSKNSVCGHTTSVQYN